MKRCPECKTVFVNDATTCPYCKKELIDDENKKKGSVVPLLIYTFGFILFIMGLYFIMSLLMK